MTPAEIEAQKERQQRMRSHNFKFGNEANNFVSMNNAAYKDLGQFS